jgi:hypothetical protein
MMIQRVPFRFRNKMTYLCSMFCYPRLIRSIIRCPCCAKPVRFWRYSAVGTYGNVVIPFVKGVGTVSTMNRSVSPVLSSSRTPQVTRPPPTSPGMVLSIRCFSFSSIIILFLLMLLDLALYSGCIRRLWHQAPHLIKLK